MGKKHQEQGIRGPDPFIFASLRPDRPDAGDAGPARTGGPGAFVFLLGTQVIDDRVSLADLGLAANTQASWTAERLNEGGRLKGDVKAMRGTEKVRASLQE